MEILKDVAIMEWPDWVAVVFMLNIAVILTTIILFSTLENSSSDGHCFAAVVGFIVSVALIATLVIGAKKAPTGEHTYTISITEPTVYKELIDKGYKISEPLYDNRNIYEVTGNPLQ